jgi:hypothetical protein
VCRGRNRRRDNRLGRDIRRDIVQESQERAGSYDDAIFSWPYKPNSGLRPMANQAPADELSADAGAARGVGAAQCLHRHK